MGTQKQPKHSKDSTSSTTAPHMSAEDTSVQNSDSSSSTTVSKDSVEVASVQNSDPTLSASTPKEAECETCTKSDNPKAKDDTCVQNDDAKATDDASAQNDDAKVKDKACAQDARNNNAKTEDENCAQGAQDNETASPFSKDSINNVAEKFEDYRSSIVAILILAIALALVIFAIRGCTQKTENNNADTSAPSTSEVSYSSPNQSTTSLSMSEIDSTLDKIPFDEGLKTFSLNNDNEPSIPEDKQRLIQEALDAIGENSIGFVLFDMQTGQGICYNADAQIYGASSFKAPYALYVCEQHLDNSSDTGINVNAEASPDNASTFNANNPSDNNSGQDANSESANNEDNNNDEDTDDNNDNGENPESNDGNNEDNNAENAENNENANTEVTNTENTGNASSFTKILIENSVVNSDNDSFIMLRALYDEQGFDDWISALGATDAMRNYDSDFPWYSARSSVKIWTEMKLYYDSNTPTSQWLASLCNQTNLSFLRNALEPLGANVYNKGGWCTSDPWDYSYNYGYDYDYDYDYSYDYNSVCDAGIVELNGKTYIASFMTSLPGAEENYPYIQNLISAAFDAQESLR